MDIATLRTLRYDGIKSLFTGKDGYRGGHCDADLLVLAEGFKTTVSPSPVVLRTRRLESAALFSDNRPSPPLRTDTLKHDTIAPLQRQYSANEVFL